MYGSAWKTATLDYDRAATEFTGDDVDLFKFPAPKWYELDGGRYLGTGDLVIIRDPEEDWVNVGTYRLQIYDKDTATIYFAPGKHGDQCCSHPCPGYRRICRQWQYGCLHQVQRQ